MRIGLFGGTFDPPHVGHLLAASDAFEALALDRLLFIPNASQPLKAAGPAASAADRLTMVRLLCQDDARFGVDPMEIERGGLSFTVDTLRAIRERESGAALFLLIGADVVATLPSWREPEAVLEMAEVVVLTRTGDGAGPAGPGRRIETRRVDISSSEVRTRIAGGLPITGFVTEAVAAYIEAHRLYATTSAGAPERTRHE